MKPIAVFKSIILLVTILAFHGEARNGDVNKFIPHRVSGSQDKNIGNEILYQIVVDRFANGNISNDRLYEGRFSAGSGGVLDWYRYFGGDLRGIIQHMGYLKSLGVTRLWITPIFENQNVLVERYQHGRHVEITSYHGYWLRDWFRLNPFFTDRGTQDYSIVDELIDAAEPEIKIYLDTVSNHTNPADATPDSLNYLQNIQPIQWNGPLPQRGAIFRDGQYVMSFNQDFELAEQSGYVRWFHSYDQSISNWNSQYEVENYQLDRLTDLNQDNPKVRDYMEDAHRFWLSRFPELAGFRIDTIKHVPQNYWKEFSSFLGNEFPDSESFGEYWDGGSTNGNSAYFYNTTRFSMLDFKFRNLLTGIFGPDDLSFSNLVNYWNSDGNVKNALGMVTFLDSHDLPRARGSLFDYTKLKQALALWFLSRGVPCIFYGLEQDLFVAGDPGDPFNRPMMQSFDQNSDPFLFVQKLVALRKKNRAARFGETHIVHETNNILGFERIFNNERLFFATSKNPIEGADEFQMQNLTFPNGRYRDLINGKLYDVRDGRVSVSLRSGDIIILGTHSRI